MRLNLDLYVAFGRLSEIKKKEMGKQSGSNLWFGLLLYGGGGPDRYVCHYVYELT